jgi:tetratricopeptide (TPR) repeat protein
VKVLSRLGPPILVALFLTVSPSHAQHTAEEYRTKGLESGVQGRLEKAKKELEEALKADPFDVKSKAGLGIIEDVNDKKINSETAIHLFKGEMHRKDKQWDKAIAEYNKAIEVEASYAETYLRRGSAYYQEGDYDKAISDYTKAIELDPKNTEAYSCRGFLNAGKGQYDKAISDYSKAIELNPKYAGSHYNRGVAYASKGQYDKAISDYSMTKPYLITAKL